MAVAFRSMSIQGVSTGNATVTTNKPSGLTVGDLMVMFVCEAAAFTDGTPSGFTQIYQSAASTNNRFTIYTKTADSADVAASTFGITGTNHATAHPMLVLYALSDAGTPEYKTSSTYASSTTSFTIPTFTPAATGDVLLCVSSCDTGDVTSFSCANNNPTWTDDGYSTMWWGYAAHHGTYNAASATGTITASFAGNVTGAFAVVAVPSAAAGFTGLTVTKTLAG